MYDSQWQRVREAVIARDRHICRICGRPTIDGHATLAPVVDHIKPHKGNAELFLADDNLQTLHKSCHDKKTRMEQYPKTGLDGWPEST